MSGQNKRQVFTFKPEAIDQLTEAHKKKQYNYQKIAELAGTQNVEDTIKILFHRFSSGNNYQYKIDAYTLQSICIFLDFKPENIVIDESYNQVLRKIKDAKQNNCTKLDLSRMKLIKLPEEIEELASDSITEEDIEYVESKLDVFQLTILKSFPI